MSTRATSGGTAQETTAGQEHEDNCGCGHDHHHHHPHHHQYHAHGGTPFVRTSPKVGRNDPCPCGSGKKYKRCCLAA